MTPDLFNGLFELSGGVFVAANVLQLWRDKKVMGVHWVAVAFFTVWGYWNLYYYPSLDQWVSAVGAITVALVNTVWLGQIIYYRRKE